MTTEKESEVLWWLEGQIRYRHSDELTEFQTNRTSLKKDVLEFERILRNRLNRSDGEDFLSIPDYDMNSETEFSIIMARKADIIQIETKIHNIVLG